MFTQWELVESKNRSVNLRLSKKRIWLISVPVKQKRREAQTSQSSAVSKRDAASHDTLSLCKAATWEGPRPQVCSVLLPGGHLLFLEHAPGVYLFNHPALDFFTKSLGLHMCLTSAQISTMSTRADRWSSEATSPSLFALRSRCKCFSLSDSVGLTSSTKSLHPSWLPAWAKRREIRPRKKHYPVPTRNFSAHWLFPHFWEPPWRSEPPTWGAKAKIACSAISVPSLPLTGGN